MLQLNNELSEQLLSDYPSYPSVVKQSINHGYIYLLLDRSYPEYIKIGMTRDLNRRYKEYNQHKPYNTAEYVAVSEVFADAVSVEKKILEILVKEFQPIGTRLEWFEVKHRERIEEIIKQAEGHFHLYIPYGELNEAN